MLPFSYTLLDLSVEDIANDLTSRLERPAYKQVIEADVLTPRKGTRSHAQEIDVEWIEAGKPAYAQRVATTVFLHSLTQTGQAGVDPADLRLAVLQPGDDPALIDKATERLYDTGWHFDYDGRRYRFRPEPSLNKLVSDEMAMVGKVRAKEELDERIQKVWKKGTFKPIYFPTEAADVDDDSNEPKIAVIHYDAATCEVADEVAPELVLKIFEHAGTQEGYRRYKNNVLFLVADKGQVDRMVDIVQRYLAIQRIVSEPARIKEFNQEQQKKLKKMREAAELDVRVATTKAYRFLFYPSSDALKKAGNLARELLPAQEQGDIEKDQGAVLLRVLKQLEKVLTADDKSIPAAYAKAKAWPQNADSVTTEDLRRAFAQRLGLKILLDPNQLKRTIKDGAKKKIWIYYSPEENLGYGSDSPAPLVEISEDTVLYTPEEAERIGLKIKGETKEPEVCPICGSVPCVCGEGEQPKKKKRKPVTAEGTPAQAFQKIADACHDQKITRIKKIFLQLDGMGKDIADDARSLGLAIPQMGKAEYHIEQSMQAELGDDESLNLLFSGSWERYKRVKTLTDAFGQEASKVKIKMTMRADYTSGLEPNSDQFQTMSDVLDSLGLGKVFITADPDLDEKEEGE